MDKVDISPEAVDTDLTVLEVVADNNDKRGNAATAQSIRQAMDLIRELRSALTASGDYIDELKAVLRDEPVAGHTKRWQDQRRAILAKGETK